jgi:hypothetical protein
VAADLSPSAGEALPLVSGERPEDPIPVPLSAEGSASRTAFGRVRAPELPYDEIARRLACTPVTARKHVSLGLQALRHTLDPEKP